MSHAALIFSHSITPRLEYIVEFLSQYYGLSFRQTSSEEQYKAGTEECKINYSYHRLLPGEIFIHSHVLLTESYIRPVKIECFEQRSYKAFFRTEGEFGFDIFAAIFYLLTRYEEYLPHEDDEFGRFPHTASLAWRENFLHLPLINIWLEDFRKWLAEKNRLFESPSTRFNFLPTYDIDMAWSYRNKGFKRNTGALLLLLMKLRFRKIHQRIRVLRRRHPDPFDSYDWMDELHKSLQLDPVYFFLVAKEKGRHDKNIDPSNAEFRELIIDLAGKYKLGLHPSWISGDHPILLSKEKHWLESIAGRSINSSRQHFIRFRLPVTYQRLLACGITEEYSMGYGSINGFRASIAGIFYWYDLKHEERTNLRIHPFCFMDANAFYEQKLSAQEAFVELKSFRSVIQSVKGTMITIWHNSFLGTAEEFKGWKEVYREFIEGMDEPVEASA